MTRMTERRVLVVDDNLEAARSFAKMLECILGHKVEFAINGYAALDLAKKLRPEMVFLDLMMPGVNGFEVCKRLKTQFGEAIRIIAVTASNSEEDRKKSLKAGCELHLVKPVARQTLETLLAEAPRSVQQDVRTRVYPD